MFFIPKLQIAQLTKTWAGKWEGYQNIIEVLRLFMYMYMYVCIYLHVYNTYMYMYGVYNIIVPHDAI